MSSHHSRQSIIHPRPLLPQIHGVEAANVISLNLLRLAPWTSFGQICHLNFGQKIHSRSWIICTARSQVLCLKPRAIMCCLTGCDGLESKEKDNRQEREVCHNRGIPHCPCSGLLVKKLP